jgi:hypothetical protein
MAKHALEQLIQGALETSGNAFRVAWSCDVLHGKLEMRRKTPQDLIQRGLVYLQDDVIGAGILRNSHIARSPSGRKASLRDDNNNRSKPVRRLAMRPRQGHAVAPNRPELRLAPLRR